MTPEDRRTQLRLDCLRLATLGAMSGSLFNQAEVLARADDYLTWCMKDDNSRPAQVKNTAAKSNLNKMPDCGRNPTAKTPGRQSELSVVSDKPKGPDARPKAGPVTRP